VSVESASGGLAINIGAEDAVVLEMG
jgi:hypothetical protein